MVLAISSGMNIIQVIVIKMRVCLHVPRLMNLFPSEFFPEYLYLMKQVGQNLSISKFGPFSNYLRMFYLSRPKNAFDSAALLSQEEVTWPRSRIT